MGFDFDNNIPIYLQIAKILKIKIISGDISPGERLPSVRDLAVELKANPNTVQRALADLENEKLIFTERTNGKFVTDNKALILKHKTAYASSLTEEYLNSMNKIGFSKEDAVNYIKSMGGNA